MLHVACKPEWIFKHNKSIGTPIMGRKGSNSLFRMMMATSIIMWDNRLQFFLLAVLGKGHKGRVGGSMALSNRGVVIRHWFSLHKQCNEWQCCHGREACWSDASGLTVIVQLRIPQLHFYFSFTFYEFKMATFQNFIPCSLPFPKTSILFQVATSSFFN